MKKGNKILQIFSVILAFILVFAPNAHALELVISENGAGAESEISTQVQQGVVVEQTNEAEISNEVDVETNTGDNGASESMGGDVFVETGDAATEVSIENSVNTSVVETECCLEENVVVISENGADSENEVELNLELQIVVVVDQQADIVNSVKGTSNTGGNSVNKSGGDVVIKTGDIFAEGEIINTSINQSAVQVPIENGNVFVNIVDNGLGSQNIVELFFNNQTNVLVENFADINNEVNWELNTGGNSANGNLGDIEIVTGDILFDFLIKNGPINTNFVDIPCCGFSDPDDPINCHDSDDDFGDQPNNFENHEVGGSDGGNTSSDSSGSSDSNSSSSSDSSSNSNNPMVLGLSDTTSAHARAIFFWAGIIMLIFGTRLIVKEASYRISPTYAKRQ